MYFKSKDAEIIFYLVELDGRCRLDKLGVNCLHYQNSEKADRWKNAKMKVLEKSTHRYKDTAIEELNNIYEQMLA